MKTIDFKALRQLGFSRENALSYVEWLAEHNEKPIMPAYRPSWIPTPLSFVYVGKENRLVRLPFFDAMRKNSIVGIAIDDVCYSISLFGSVAECGDFCLKGRDKVQSDLQFQSELWSKKTKCLGYPQAFKRKYFVPSMQQLQKAYALKALFNSMITMLCDRGMAPVSTAWKDKKYVCLDVNDAYKAIDFSNGKVVDIDLQQNNAYFVRPALPILIIDPDCPVNKECEFDWEKYSICEECL